MAEYERLSEVAASNISEALVRLVSTYSGLPFTGNAKTVQYGCLTKESGIGLFPMQGAIYKSKYISGSYVGLFPFRVVYKCQPTSNKARITAQELVDGLAEYLKGYTGQLRNDEHISVQQFAKVSPTYQLEATADGYEQFTCEMQVEYYYKA